MAAHSVVLSVSSFLCSLFVLRCRNCPCSAEKMIQLLRCLPCARRLHVLHNLGRAALSSADRENLYHAVGLLRHLEEITFPPLLEEERIRMAVPLNCITRRL